MGIVNLTWDEPVDTTGLSYILKRDGAILGTYTPGTSSASDAIVVNGASYAYTLETENSSGNIGTASVNISIPAIAPVLGTIPDQNLHVGTPLSLDLSVYVTSDGGDPNITWAVATGTLPAGLVLDANTGVVSGTPTTAETQVVGYIATNSGGASNTSSHSIDVQVAITAPVLGTIPDLVIDAGALLTLDLNTYVTSDGGDPTFTWAVATGALPVGLALDANTGIVSGTPTTVETQIVGYVATNSGGASNTSNHSIDVQIAVPVLGTIPDQTTAIGISYSLDLSTYLTSDGGDPAITWAVATGTLPVGLSLDTNTGIVSGTPTTVETQAIGYTATNSAGVSNTSAHTMTVLLEQELPIASVGEIAIDGSNGVLEAYLNDAINVTGFRMILYTNTTGIDNTTTPDAFTRPVGGNYQDVVLDRNSFEIVNGVVAYPRVTFNNTGTDYSLPVTGWALITEETTPVQVCLCNSGQSVNVIAGGSPYQVDARFEFTAGAGNGVTDANALNLIALSYFVGPQTDLAGALVLNLVDIGGVALLANGGYAEVTLNGAWTITNGTGTYPVQSWTAVGAAFSSDVAGAIMETGTGVLMHTDMNSNPVTIAIDDTYNYDLSIG